MIMLISYAPLAGKVLNMYAESLRNCKLCPQPGCRFFGRCFISTTASLHVALGRYFGAWITRACLRRWNCIEIAGQRYLTDDFRISCDDSRHTLYLAWAVAALIIYIIGTPLTFYSVVRIARGHMVDE
jgi:hypothetical protein